MSSVAQRVRALVASLAPAMFTMKHLLGCGSANAIYIELCRLRQQGVITRQANGVYKQSGTEVPGPVELAAAKAERFGKRIFWDPTDTQNEFRTDGCKTSFDTTFHGRLHFSQLAARRRLSLETVPSAPETPQPAQMPLSASEPSSAHGETRCSVQNENLEQSFLQQSVRMLALLIGLLEKYDSIRTDRIHGPPAAV